MLIERSRLSLSMDVENWINEVTQIDGVRFVPVGNEISIKSTRLPGEFHKDPADPIRVATVRKLAAPWGPLMKKLLITNTSKPFDNFFVHKLTH